MLYEWKIKSYAYLVKIGKYKLETVEENTQTVVEESYRTPVALYLATGEIAV